eukprot:scaffold133366_cov76-Phaeocystis_antarctica.AAC.1
MDASIARDSFRHRAQRQTRGRGTAPRRKLGATELHIFVTQRLCVIFPCCSDARRARASHGAGRLRVLPEHESGELVA